MTVIRSVSEPEFLVDYSTLVVRESGSGTGADDERLSEQVATLSVTGRLAIAGQGWLRAHTRAEYLHVVLELHDEQPLPEPVADGVEMMETPYLSTSGQAMLDSLVAMAGSTVLQLDGPGLYRVRVRKQPDGDLERWRLSFWRDEQGTEPPRWHALAPVADDRTAAARSWRSVLPYEAVELLEPLQGQPGAALTVEEYGEFWRRHGRHRGYLDDVLLPERPLRTTGFPDLDATLAHSRDAYDEDRRATWTNLAQQLGIELPRTRGDLLTLLVAAGLLARSEDGAYAPVPNPSHCRDVLHLPEQHLRGEERLQEQRLHGDLAADIERVVLWSPARTHSTTLRVLAERLVAPAPRVRSALEYATHNQHLVVQGESADAEALLVLKVPDQVPDWDEGSSGADRTGVDDSGASTWTHGRGAPDRYMAEDVTFHYDNYLTDDGEDDDDDAAHGDYLHVTTLVGGAGRWRPQPLEEGPPPQWGVIVGDELWRWADGRPSAVRLDDGFCERALHTPVGTLLLHVISARLVTSDGQLHDLGPLSPVALDRTGRVMAGVEAKYGRRRATFRLHRIDLTTLERTTMPWPVERLISDIAFDDVDKALTFRAEVDPDDPSSDGAIYRWTPGEDPLIGRSSEGRPSRNGLRERWDDTGLHLTWPSGTQQHYPVDGQVRPAPLAPMLYSLRSDPPAVAVWHLDETQLVQPRILPLPEEAQAHATGPSQPVWETGDSLLLAVSPYAGRGGTRALRLDVRSGEVYRVDLPQDDGTGMDHVMFVEGPPGP